LPLELVNATRWNHPSRTSTETGAVGTTSVAALTGRKIKLGAGGGFGLSACLLDPLKQAASTFGANTPTASADIARRRLIGGGTLALLTTDKDTGRTAVITKRAVTTRSPPALVQVSV
jgi:hypothetical protein